MAEQHRHKWTLPDGPFVVVATNPAKRPYSCACGAFTHDPETGMPCDICAPEDYARRIDEFVPSNQPGASDATRKEPAPPDASAGGSSRKGPS